MNPIYLQSLEGIILQDVAVESKDHVWGATVNQIWYRYYASTGALIWNAHKLPDGVKAITDIQVGADNLVVVSDDKQNVYQYTPESEEIWTKLSSMLSPMQVGLGSRREFYYLTNHSQSHNLLVQYCGPQANYIYNSAFPLKKMDAAADGTVCGIGYDDQAYYFNTYSNKAARMINGNTGYTHISVASRNSIYMTSSEDNCLYQYLGEGNLVKVPLCGAIFLEDSREWTTYPIKLGPDARIHDMSHGEDGTFAVTLFYPKRKKGGKKPRYESFVSVPYSEMTYNIPS